MPFWLNLRGGPGIWHPKTVRTHLDCPIPQPHPNRRGHTLMSAQVSLNDISAPTSPGP